jgi:hypothetical protein
MWKAVFTFLKICEQYHQNGGCYSRKYSASEPVDHAFAMAILGRELLEE